MKLRRRECVRSCFSEETAVEKYREFKTESKKVRQGGR